jgi:hypothetical protein
MRDLKKSFGLAGLSIVLISSMLVGCGGGGATVTEEQRIVAANNQFRSRITNLLNNAAAEFGVAIEPENAACIAYKDPSGIQLIVNTNIQGIQSLQLEDLRNGADVLFTFVRYSDGTNGFFVTRVRQENGRWIARLRALDGEVDASDVSVLLRENEEKPELTVDWDDGPCIDIKWKIFKIKLCIPIDLKDLLPLRLTQGSYEPQMTEAANEALNSVRSAIANRSRNSSSEVILVSRDDMLWAAQIHAGVSEWTQGQLTQQPMMTAFFQSSGRPNLPARITPAQLQNSGGTWTLPAIPATELTIKQKSSPNSRPERFASLNEDSLVIGCLTADSEVELNIPLE